MNDFLNKESCIVGVYFLGGGEKQSASRARAIANKITNHLKSSVSVRYYSDRDTAKSFEQLDKVMTEVKSGFLDVVGVGSIEDFRGLFPSENKLFENMEILSGLKVEIFVFDEGKFYATDSAEWVLKILRSFQKRRTDERSARAQSGARAALKKGKIIGRPKKVDASKIQKLRSKGLTIARIAKALSISVGAVHRSLNNRKLSHDEQSLI